MDLKSKKWGHKWGYKDTEFLIFPEDVSVLLKGKRYALSGYKIKGLLPFVESILGFKLDLYDLHNELQSQYPEPPSRNLKFCEALENDFSSSRYSFEKCDRLLHSHGQTSVDEIYPVLYGELPKLVDMVFFPESEEEIKKIVKMAQDFDVCLIPYGGGTNVSGALKLPMDEKRMIVAVNMQSIDQILWLDKENNQACIQAGITGKQLEECLDREGYTMGHEPDSLEFSTLGGWIATNASGMKRNKYGNIEDIVDNITMITSAGELSEKQAFSRSSSGMRLNPLLFGSEGNLGIITKAVVKIRPKPEKTLYQSVVFPDFAHGALFLRELSNNGNLPASVRLLDNVQFRFGLSLRREPQGLSWIAHKIQDFVLFKLLRLRKDQLVAATFLMEGCPRALKQQEKEVLSIAKKYKGIKGGRKDGQRGYAMTFAIAYIRELFSSLYIMGETFETTVPWDKIHDVYNGVRQEAMLKHKEYNLPGAPLICARITQLYHSGVCIYFTYGMYHKGVKDAREIFIAIEHSFRELIIEKGGSISHHHGVGKVRKDFLQSVFSESTIKVLKNFKKSSDPQNIFGISNNVLHR